MHLRRFRPLYHNSGACSWLFKFASVPSCFVVEMNFLSLVARKPCVPPQHRLNILKLFGHEIQLPVL
jgi:hypothetical protein